MKRFLSIALVVIMMLSVVACGGKKTVGDNVATATPTNTVSPTQEPTNAVTPTATAESTATANPTATVMATATAKPGSTTTPTATVKPGTTATPPATINPTATVKPGTIVATPTATIKPAFSPEPTVAPPVRTPRVTVNVGEIITFGTYEQDNNTANGKEKIEWLVILAEGNYAFVISKYALASVQYNSSERNITWEDCTLRRWLNNEFINSAFSTEEQAKIAKVVLSANKNPSYDTNPGNATSDKIFLLSIDDANKYFNSASARMCEATASAISGGTSPNIFNNNCYWWLRTPGSPQNCVAYVDSYGNVDNIGRKVSYYGYAVRPAMFIDLRKF